MSSTTGASSPAGTATAMGLVLSRLSAAPHAGMWLLRPLRMVSVMVDSPPPQSQTLSVRLGAPTV